MTDSEFPRWLFDVPVTIAQYAEAARVAQAMFQSQGQPPAVVPISPVTVVTTHRFDLTEAVDPARGRLGRRLSYIEGVAIEHSLAVPITVRVEKRRVGVRSNNTWEVVIHLSLPVTP